MKDFVLIAIAEVRLHVSRIFSNFGLKFVLWIPYMLTLLYFGIGMAVVQIRYDIPIDEFWYVMIGVIVYGSLLDIAQHIRTKYWRLTKCKDL